MNRAPQAAKLTKPFGHIPLSAAAVNNREPLGEGIARDLGGAVQRSETGVGHKVFGERGEERAEE